MEAFTAGSFGPAQAATSPRAESPLRLLCLALLWLVTAGAAGVAADFVIGFGIGFHNAVARSAPAQAWRLSPLAYALISTSAMQLVLLLAARRRGRILGGGDRNAGLGSAPLRRPALLAGLAILQMVGVIAWAVLLSHWLPLSSFHTLPQRLFVSHAASPAMLAAFSVVAVCLAPVCEELFFRGWLWTGLRRHWGVLPVMVATAVPWLLLHMADGGVRRPLFLLPAAVVLSLARHLCGGVRASIVLHVLNNLFAVGLLGILASLGHH